MTWREKKRPASFRGVPFHVDAHDMSGGHRLAVAEIPGADDPIIQNMGKAPTRYRVDAFVLGVDYFSGRDALLAAFETSGAAQLIHPWLGSKRVRVESYTLRESASQGGYAVFTVDFIRDASPSLQAATFSSREERVSRVTDAVIELVANAQVEFSSGVRAAGVAGFVADEAAEQVAVLAEQLGNQLIHMRGDAAKFLRRIKNLADGAIRIASDPGGLAGDIVGAIEALSSGIHSREASLRVLLGMAPPARGPVSSRSGQAQIAAENHRRIWSLIGGAAIGEACNRAVQSEWSSREGAIATRETLKLAIQVQGECATTLGWMKLHALSASVAQVLPGPLGELPGLRRIKIDEPEPALVLAYRLHGSIGGAGDILQRNGVAHPLFVPASEELEVVSRG